MKKGLLIGLAVLLGLLGLVAMLLATRAVVIFPTPEPSAQPQSAPAASPHVEQSFPKPDIPELTENERFKAVSLATDNPQVAQLLAGREYDVTSVGVWHTSGDLQKIGAGVILSLAQPAILEADWPTIDYGRAGVTASPYQQHTEHFTAENVQRLVVMVDLRRGQVVSISPGPEASTPPRNIKDLDQTLLEQ